MYGSSSHCAGVCIINKPSSLFPQFAELYHMQVLILPSAACVQVGAPICCTGVWVCGQVPHLLHHAWHLASHLAAWMWAPRLHSTAQVVQAPGSPGTMACATLSWAELGQGHAAETRRGRESPEPPTDPSATAIGAALARWEPGVCNLTPHWPPVGQTCVMKEC